MRKIKKATQQPVMIFIILLLVLFFCIIFFRFGTATQISFNVTENMTNISYEIYSSCEENFSCPKHPILEDCKKVCGGAKKSFCIDDVAEISNNISICNKINDWEIRTFCIARISLNNTMCQTLRDKELMKSCLESIEMKKQWMGLS